MQVLEAPIPDKDRDWRPLQLILSLNVEAEDERIVHKTLRWRVREERQPSGQLSQIILSTIHEGLILAEVLTQHLIENVCYEGLKASESLGLRLLVVANLLVHPLRSGAFKSVGSD